MPDHPVQLLVTDDLHRSRLTVFFRLLLAIPHFIWLGLWSIGVFFAAIIGWFAALFTGHLPQGLHDFFGMYVRYATHLGAYLAIAANPYPSFTGTPGYAVDVSIPERQDQPRWKTAFRLFLAIPALMLAATLGSFVGGGGGSQAAEDGASKAEWLASSGVGGVAAVCAVLGWFASRRARPDAARAAQPRRLRARLHGPGVRLRAAAHRPLPELRPRVDRAGSGSCRRTRCGSSSTTTAAARA